MSLRNQQEKNVKRLCVLISAYACEPNRGSEPEVGWQWVMHLANHCDLTVVTRSNNRDVIEAELKNISGPHPNFVYIDLSKGMLILKKKLRPRNLAVSLYYVMWQRSMRKKLAELCMDYDVIHHLTFASFRLPFVVTGKGKPCIVGPVGGCEEFPRDLLPKDVAHVRRKELFRNLMTRIHTRLGLGMQKYRSVDVTLAATPEMADVFNRWGVAATVMPQIGMHNTGEEVRRNSIEGSEDEFRLLFVGNILYWKGVELILASMAELPDNVTITYVGDGPDMKALKNAVHRYDLERRVNIVGRRTRNEVLKMYDSYDLFFYPSVHDSGSFTVLEAMASGLPVVCLDRGGPAVSVTSECGFVVQSGAKEETCRGLAKAIQYYLDNPSVLRKHGIQAKKRINEVYNWESKAKQMIGVYTSVTEQ